MAFSRGELEYLHSIGRVPDWVYYQTNGDDPHWNYMRQKEAIRKKYLERENEQKLEKEIERQVEEKLEKALEKALEKLLEDFNK